MLRVAPTRGAGREGGRDELLYERACRLPACLVGVCLCRSKELFWLNARDKSGNPVLVFRTSAHEPGAYSPQMFTRHIVHLLELGRKEYGLGKDCQVRHQQQRAGGVSSCFNARKAGTGGCRNVVMWSHLCVWHQVTLLVDRVGSGLRNQEPGLVGAVVSVLQEHYPEMLSVAHVAPVNWFLYLIWVVFRFVLDPNTAKRVREGGRSQGGSSTTRQTAIQDAQPRRSALGLLARRMAGWSEDGTDG